VIEAIACTGSTNADLAQRLIAGESLGEGDWLVADRQSQGRGRLGRAWDDGQASGNFMGSCIVRLDAHQPHPGSLALVAGLAVQAAVAPWVPAPLLPLLKWPNDVMIGAAKLAGILLEVVGGAVVVGVGVNLAMAPDISGRETVALSAYGPAPDRDAFAQNLAMHFAHELGLWRQYGLAALVSRWQAVAHPLGTALSVTHSDGSQVQGRFAGLDEMGALRLTLADGTAVTVHAGDISVI